MNRDTLKLCLASVIGAATVLTIGGCGKMTEPFNDADRAGTNSSPADVITFPDGFSNVSSKCDGTNRVYVLYHQNDPYGGIAVVPNDPRCEGSR